MRSRTALILALALLLTMVGFTLPTASADGAIKVNPAGVFPIVEGEPYELSVFMALGANIKYEDNTLLNYWQEKTNVKVNLIVAGSEPEQQVNLMLASGENLPDCFSYGLGMDRLTTYGEMGTILQLDDLIKEWTVNVQGIWDYTAPFGEKACRTGDGKLYAVPAFNGCFHCEYSHRGWINTTWLKNLGLAMPTTTDEYYNVLKAFMEGDANGNGDATDEVPLVGITDGWNSTPENFLMDAFVTNSLDYRMNVVDGQLVPAYMTDAWREGLRFYRKLYEEKLLDNDCFVMASTQASMLAVNPKGNQVGSFFSGVPTQLSAEGDIPFQYEAMLPLAGPDGNRSTPYAPSMPWGKFAVTANCKNPEIAVRWADSWLENTPEMYVLQRGGTTGTKEYCYLADPAEGKLGMDGSPALYVVNAAALWRENNVWLADANPTFLSHEMRGGGATSTEEGGYDQELVIYQAALKYSPFKPKEILPPSLTFTEDQAAVAGEIQTMVDTYVKENFAAFVTGKKNIDTDWDAYLGELNKMGVDTLKQTLSDAWHKQYD